MPSRRLFALLTVVFALAAPSAALAQSAGDEQYVDPLSGLTQDGSSGSSQGSSGGTQSSGGSSQGTTTPSQSSGGTSTPATPTATTPATTSAAPAGSEATLARTGVDLRVVAGLGLLLLLGGFALRRGAHGRR